MCKLGREREYLQTTAASSSVHPDEHTDPKRPFIRTSTRPEVKLDPSTSLTIPVSEIFPIIQICL